MVTASSLLLSSASKASVFSESCPVPSKLEKKQSIGFWASLVSVLK